MSDENIFRASNIAIGTCGSPTCRNVHISLCDANGVTRAHAIIHCDAVIPIVTDILDVAEKVSGLATLDAVGPGSTVQ